MSLWQIGMHPALRACYLYPSFRDHPVRSISPTLTPSQCAPTPCPICRPKRLIPLQTRTGLSIRKVLLSQLLRRHLLSSIRGMNIENPRALKVIRPLNSQQTRAWVHPALELVRSRASMASSSASFNDREALTNSSLLLVLFMVLPGLVLRRNFLNLFQ